MGIVTISPDVTPAALATIAELEAAGWINGGDVDEFGTCHERPGDDSRTVSVQLDGSVIVSGRHGVGEVNMTPGVTLADILGALDDLEAGADREPSGCFEVGCGDNRCVC